MLAFHSIAPNRFHPYRCGWDERTCSCSSPSTALLPLCFPISASCVSSDPAYATPTCVTWKETMLSQNRHFWWLKLLLPTGICSTMGSSLAIVPARSQEFVMLTSDWNNSAQKYPHVIPSNCQPRRGKKRKAGVRVRMKNKKKFLIQDSASHWKTGIRSMDALNHEFFI